MRRTRGAWLLLVVALPVWAKEMPPGCAWLCGSWVLNAEASDTPGVVVDVAMEKYKETSGSRRSPQSSNFDGPETRAQVRDRLIKEITPPPALVLGERGDEVLIKVEGVPDRRIHPGEPHSRVDSQGTAKIRADWKKDALVIEESYSGRHGQSETYALQPDGTLLLTRVFEREGVKPMRQRLAYRRR
jgi:hypothetical protein